MPRKTHRPIDELESELKSLVEDVWAGPHAEWETDALYYDGEYTVELPEWITKSRKVTPTDPRQTIDHAVDQIITAEPVARRPQVGEKKKARELASTLGTWATHFLRTLNRDAMVPPFKTFGKHLFLYGYAALYGPIWDDAIWPLRPNRQRKDFDEALTRRGEHIKRLFPFRLEVPHPSKILLDPSELKQPTFGYLRTHRYLRSLREEFDKPREQMLGKDWAEVEVYTYWDANQHTVWAGSADDRVLIDEKENPYGFVPFRQAFLGLGRDVGFNEIGAQSSGTGGLTKMAVGFLRFLRSQIRSKALQATALDHMLYRWAFQHILTTEDGEQFTDEYGQGMVMGGLPSPLRDNVIWEDVPNVPGWVFQVASDRRADIEAGTFGDILRGGRPTGVDTASPHFQITAKAKQVFNNPIQQINHVASLVTGDAARLVTVFKDPVTLRGMIGKDRAEVTIDADDLQDNFIFDVDIEASDPIEQSDRLSALFALKQAGQIDSETFVEEMPPILKITQKELKDRLLKQGAIEIALQDPEIQALIKAEVQRRFMDKVAGNGAQALG